MIQSKRGGGLYIVHLTGRLVVFVPEARHGRHVVLILALGTSLVCSVFVCVFLDILCIPKMFLSANKQEYG